MSRTRLIRPEFFADELLSSVNDATRLFYIGLWTLCDDAGYFEARPRQIAAALYPYRGPASRERTTNAAMTALVELDRVKLLECGLHGVVPTLPRHGVKGGNKAETFRDRHLHTCMSVRVRTSPDKSSSVSVSDSVSESDSGRPGANGKERTPFGEGMAASGLRPELAGRRR
jgi:hypothetical protein